MSSIGQWPAGALWVAELRKHTRSTMGRYPWTPARSRGTGLRPVDSSKVLTAEALDRFLGAAAQHLPDSFPLVLLLADTGCRIGEAIGLQWADVDLDGGTLWIERSVDHLGRVGPTKTRRARSVELSTRLRDVLESIRPDLFGDETPVFPNSEGRYKSSSTKAVREAERR